MAEKLVEICAIASECNNRNKNEVNFLWLDISRKQNVTGSDCDGVVV